MNHHGTTGEASMQDMLHLIAPPSTSDFIGVVFLDLALGLVSIAWLYLESYYGNFLAIMTLELKFTIEEHL